MTSTTDQQALLTQIIEAGRLGMKLFAMQNEDAELEQTGTAFDAAMAELRRINNQEAPIELAVLMVSKLLAGAPVLMTSNTPKNIRLCIAVAHEIGATVDDIDGDFAEVLPAAVRSIRLNPPERSAQQQH